MITSIKAFKESILVPRNLEGREDKLKQNNYKILQQEVIEGDFIIDSSWVFDNPVIKCKKIIGNVRIFKIGHIPEWFENIEIEGNFDCSDNKLTSLKGCPKKISRNFHCTFNYITSLKYGPEFVGKSYFCYKNKLTTLKGCPQIINGNFSCAENLLTSLEYGPISVKNNFDCDDNQLTTLEYGPNTVGRDYKCSGNKLTSLEGCPKEISGNFLCRNNKPGFTRQYVRSLCNVKGNIFI